MINCLSKVTDVNVENNSKVNQNNGTEYTLWYFCSVDYTSIGFLTNTRPEQRHDTLNIIIYGPLRLTHHLKYIL